MAVDLGTNFEGFVLSFVVVGVISLVVFAVLRRSRGRTTVASAMDVAAPAAPRARPVTQAELAVAKGEGGGALWVAVKDPYGQRVVVFDVRSGSDFYGPGGPYHLFAGRNATHGLAKSSVDVSQVEGDLSKLTASEKDTHMQWFAKYTQKYPQVGWLVDDEAKKE